MESRHTSRYFFKRAGRKHNSRLWTKLAVACDTASHFFTAATVSLGPANNAPQFRPLMAQASLAVGYDRVLGDAAFDGEESHRYCREDLGVRSTVIPINRRNGGRKWPKTRYRRQMVKRFRKKPRGSRHKRVYGRRWQAESAFSRHKRLLGSACGASRMRRANTSATCGYSPTTSCSSPLQVRGFQQSSEGYERSLLQGGHPWLLLLPAAAATTLPPPAVASPRPPGSPSLNTCPPTPSRRRCGPRASASATASIRPPSPSGSSCPRCSTPSTAAARRSPASWPGASAGGWPPARPTPAPTAKPAPPAGGVVGPAGP